MRKALLILVLACSTLGCSGGIPVPAFRALYDAVAVPYAAYVNDDPALDAGQKRIRLQTVKSAARLLLEAEK